LRKNFGFFWANFREVVLISSWQVVLNFFRQAETLTFQVDTIFFYEKRNKYRIRRCKPALTIEDFTSVITTDHSDFAFRFLL
jgi:hypothetical protein